MSNLHLVKGFGPKTIEYLNKLNIYTIDDLIMHFPFRYELLKRSDLFNTNQDEKICIDGYIDSNPSLFRFKGNMNKMSFRLRTETAIINIVIFNRAFLKQHLTLNRVITVIGKWDKQKNTISASDILFEPLTDEGRIEPIYRTTSGLNKKILKKYIANALTLYKNNIKDFIPSFLTEKYHFLDKSKALTIMHNPEESDNLKKALLRLKYEELFMFMLKINVLKQRNNQEQPGRAKNIDMNKVEAFIKTLPFTLTIDQRKAVDDIIADLASPHRMNRLLQGDVGSGKTVVAVIAIYAIVLAGYQSALMVPTEVLAKQHFYNIRQLFKDTPVRVELLIGSFSKAEKKQVYDRLEKGEIDLIIGTHTLIQEEVKYANLGLVITDEQHRFGVNQRSHLRNKAEMPEVLYMSATPIPRTYALTIYGDMEISTIKTVPHGRKEIITYLKDPKDIKDVLLMIQNELNQHHQIYIVAPLIEESDKIELENVNKLKHQFELAFGKLYKVDLLHGKMDMDEKERVMTAFLNNEVQILISTTVIEVGIDVKNATMMIIFDAERFGLSTIHQLRGRVGRSDLQSYCVLISSKERERLNILTTTTDGFAISEADFKLRGQGDLFGIRQSGDMNFHIADLKQDFKILMQAKEDSAAFLDNNLINQYIDIEEELNKTIHLN